MTQESWVERGRDCLTLNYNPQPVVFERGVGETLACGTGACGAVVSGHLRGLLDDEVQVDLPGGSLQIDWDGKGSVIMTGPTTNVFEGRIHI